MFSQLAYKQTICIIKFALISILWPRNKVEKSLNRGDPVKNALFVTCKQHDLAYAQLPTDRSARQLADKQLEQTAWERLKSEDPKFDERAAPG